MVRISRKCASVVTCRDVFREFTLKVRTDIDCLQVGKVCKVERDMTCQSVKSFEHGKKWVVS